MVDLDKVLKGDNRLESGLLQGHAGVGLDVASEVWVGGDMVENLKVSFPAVDVYLLLLKHSVKPLFLLVIFLLSRTNVQLQARDGDVDALLDDGLLLMIPLCAVDRVGILVA